MPLPNKTKALAAAGVLTAVALILHIVEAQLPPIFPIPGIKLGLANTVTVFVVYYLDRRYATGIQLVRILLGSIFAGQAMSLIYSLSGGVLALLVICLLRFPKKQMWAVSIFAAIAHSIGQIAAAYFVIQSGAVLLYLPYLLIASILSGGLTGACAQATYFKIKGAEHGED